jgi:hypothetical protein
MIQRKVDDTSILSINIDDSGTLNYSLEDSQVKSNVSITIYRCSCTLVKSAAHQGLDRQLLICLWLNNATVVCYSGAQSY